MNIYSVTIPLQNGTADITAITAGCGTYDEPAIPINNASPTFIQDLQDALNAIELFKQPEVENNELFTVTGDAQEITITTKCSNCQWQSITYNGEIYLFTEGVSCGEAQPTIGFAIECSDLSCISFTDKTKAYDPVNAPLGYGYPPNYPGFDDIDHIEFYLIDVDDAMTAYRFADSNYMPNAAGDNKVCLIATNFLKVSDNSPLASFVGGKSYIFQYRVYSKNGELSCTAYNNFIFPCCGADLVGSDLAINYKVNQKLGCGSFDFKDTTGAYNEDTNPGGYGAPNPGYGDITATLIKVTLGDGTVVNITTFIPTADEPTINITAAMLGYSGSNIPDQIVRIEYSVFTAGTCRAGYKDNQNLFHCNTAACLRSKGIQALRTNCEPCKGADGTVNRIVELTTKYLILLGAFSGNAGCVSGDIENLYLECSKDCGPCSH